MVSTMLDDFTKGFERGLDAWTVFSDRVMGGVSFGQAAIEPVHNVRALRLTGTVSLERNGGFLQVARALHGAARPCLDASAFSGIALTVCGTQGTYFIHLRTTDTRAPWQYYSAVLPVTNTWQDVVLTWNDFSPRNLNAPLAPQCLTRIGLVAAQSVFNADLAVSRIAFVQAHCRQRTNLLFVGPQPRRGPAASHA